MDVVTLPKKKAEYIQGEDLDLIMDASVCSIAMGVQSCNHSFTAYSGYDKNKLGTHYTFKNEVLSHFDVVVKFPRNNLT